MQKTRNPLLFIIEDSIVYKDLIVGYMQSKKFDNIRTFKNGEECLKELHQKPELIILDYSFVGISGLELMTKVKEEHPEIDFIFISAQNDIETAVKIMKLGAADYIVKNDKAPQRLVKSVERMVSVAKKENMRKGFRIGVFGFFIMFFIIVITIILLAVFFDVNF